MSENGGSLALTVFVAPASMEGPVRSVSTIPPVWSGGGTEGCDVGISATGSFRCGSASPALGVGRPAVRFFGRGKDVGIWDDCVGCGCLGARL